MSRREFSMAVSPCLPRLPSAPCLAMAQHQLRTHAPQHTTCTGCNDLLDHLIGAGEEGFGNRKADRLRGFDIDDQLEFRRLLNRQITRLLTFEDATGVNADHAKRVRKT